MSDEMDSIGVSEVEPGIDQGVGAPGSGKGKGFFSTTLGRVILIGGAVAVVLSVIAVVVVLVLGASLFTTASTSLTTGTVPEAPGVPAGGATEASGSAAASLVPTEPPLVPAIANRDVFSPRDPFEVIEPPVIPTETVTAESNVLILKDIITEDGVRKGVFVFNGVQYVGGAGDVLGSTNWKVLVVHDSSVEVLYGDDRVTLSIGQGIQK